MLNIKHLCCFLGTLHGRLAMLRYGILQGSQKSIAEKVGLEYGWLIQHGSNYTSGYGGRKVSDKVWPKLRVARRFGAALVLQDIMQEVSRIT